MFCRERVARLGALQQSLDHLGVGLFAIGNGAAWMAQTFVEDYSPSYPIFTDPSRESFKLAGMQRRVGLSLKSLQRGRRAMAEGHRQGATRGDVLQQGGVILLEPSGQVAFRHIDSEAGEQVDLDALMEAAEALRER